MATGTLRIILVAVGLAIGAFVLARAFPEGGAVVPVSTDEPTNGGPTTEVPGTGGGAPADGATDAAEPGGDGENVSPQDVRIQVLNGTDETGLAEDTAAFVESLGYGNVTFGDATTDTDTTTIYFSSGFRDEARTLRDEAFPDAAIQGGTAGDVPVDLTVILGSDYVEAN